MCPRLITSPHPSLVLTTLNTLQLFRHTSPSLVSTGVPQKTNPVPVSPCVWLSLLSSRFSVSVEWMNVQQGVHENHQLVLFPKKARDVCLYSRSISRPWCTLSWTIHLTVLTSFSHIRDQVMSEDFYPSVSLFGMFFAKLPQYHNRFSAIFSL